MTYDKVLCFKAFNIAENSEYDGYQRVVTIMVYNFFDKKALGGGAMERQLCKIKNQVKK